ncbi:MAG: type II 3-dehydroquinate dehydratase [candidate division KSB1 bacterium]|nr:type II 3-dehydroquinate dehydratase [candidate division KSB1 bacterium]
MKPRILIVHGPNLNLLGEREPDVYGTATLKDVNAAIRSKARELNVKPVFYQSNHEGRIIDFLHRQRKTVRGLVINPGALTHYSYALHDAIIGICLPAVEVHLSDIHKREEFRRISVTRPACLKQISGKGIEGYVEGLEFITDILNNESKTE